MSNEMHEHGNAAARAGYVRALRGRRAAWRAGLAGARALTLAGRAVVAGLILLALDLFLAWPEAPRRVAPAAAGAALALLALVRIARDHRRTLDDAARRMDRQAGDARCGFRTALELARRPPAPGTLGAFLVGRSIARAREALVRRPVRKELPRAELAAAARALALCAALAGALFLAFPGPLRVALARFADPARDVPPWSRWTFRVEPERAEVVYGEPLDLSVRVGGGALRTPVLLVTRAADGTVHRTPCYREPDQRFTQRLERVTEPLAFCFEAGRARSRWHALDVRLQPRVLSARVTLAPPAYSGRPARVFALGEEPLAGLRGTRVELEVTSNRPLGGGELTIRPEDGAGGDAVPGAAAGVAALRFAWTIERAAALDVMVRDLRGTPLEQPVRAAQQVIPDAPPAVVLHAPGPFSLAAPNARLPLSGRAEDDLGLARVDWVRTVQGFHDRLRRVGPDAPARALDWEETLDLAALGVEPGQTLEFYLEAQDTNPARLGLGSSAVARVRIVSEQEYVELLRSRAVLEEFRERFTALRAALDAATSALETAAAAEDPAAAAVAARERLAELEAVAGALADELQLFELEQQLSETAARIRAAAADARRALEGAPSAAAARAAAQAALDRLRPEGVPVRAQEEAAAQVAAAARLLRLAARLRELVERQRETVRRLERFRHGGGESERALLSALGAVEADIRDAYLAIAGEFPSAAAALPDALAALREDAIHFAAVMREAGVTEALDRAVEAARRTDGRGAYVEAQDALDRMNQLLEQGLTGGLCRGGMGEGWCPPDLADTLREMLDALMGKGGAGLGRGTGGGVGGGTGGGAGGGTGPDSGYWMSGSGGADVPAFGPARGFSGEGGAGTAGAGRGRGGGAGAEPETVREAFAPGTAATPAGRGRGIARTPDRYREAVQRYFDAAPDSGAGGPDETIP